MSKYAILDILGQAALSLAPVMGGGVGPNVEAALAEERARLQPNDSARDRSPRAGVAEEVARGPGTSGAAI